ncbi:MAG: EAL domain-containing protein, partial [Amphritea sp.]|nr:EAL domain-containing protein [Amphritea sp.]
HIDALAINLSGQSLGDDALLGYIIRSIEQGLVPARMIKFEITETAAIANLKDAQIFIKSLKKLGCRFALDDFGSGLSSFGYLKNLPVDLLKIDGMFVRDILTDPIDEAMVRSINEIGHIMKMETIAEFVENDLIMARLKRLGVDYAQGYAISRPEPIDSILKRTPQAEQESERDFQ